MTEPLKSVVLQRLEGDQAAWTVWAVITDAGELEIERSDYGPRVDDGWARDESEFNLTVPAEFKDTVLLLLIQERFSDEAAFRQWLTEKGLPFRESHYP